MIPSTLWIKKLTGQTVVTILLKKQLRSIEKIMFEQSTERGVRWLKYLTEFGVVSANYYSFELSHSKGQRSFTMDYEKHFMRIHQALCNKMWKHHDLAVHWYNEESVPKVRLYLERELANKTHRTVDLLTYILLNNSSNDLEESWEKNIVLLSSSWWLKLIRKELETTGVTIVFSWMDFDYPKYKEYLAKVTKGFYHIAVSRFNLDMVCNKLFGRINKTSRFSKGKNERVLSDGYKCSNMYIRGCDLEERHDLFWFSGADLKPEEVVITFENEYPISLEEMRALKNQGFNYLMAKKEITESIDEEVWSPNFNFLKEKSFRFACKLIPHLKFSSVCLWQWLQIIILMRRVDWYECLYESHNIRVNTSQGYEIEKSIAMDNLGGIQIWVQWTLWYLQHPQLPIGSQVAFKWGKGSFNVLYSDQSISSENVLISGFIYDQYFDSISIKEKSSRIRNKLSDAGAEYIVALFDETLDKDVWNRSMLTAYYTIFLEECVRDATFGLVIKPKTNSIFQELSEISEILEQAVSTGRCIILKDTNENQNAIKKKNSSFPLLAAMASDLSVNLMCSTGVESWLSGTPAIYFDPLNLTGGLLHKTNEKVQLVYQDLKNLIQAIRDHRQTQGGISGFGDHEAIADQIDPFRDGQAGLRIGTYIRWLLDSMNSGQSRDEAILDANQKYSEKWGYDKIVIQKPI